MMKRFAALVMVFVLIAGFTAPAFAADNMLTKLGRGIANVVSSPLEITQHMGKENDENGLFASMTTGILTGIWGMTTRILAGAYEIVSFPIPYPKDYAPIITDPEYFCQL